MYTHMCICVYEDRYIRDIWFNYYPIATNEWRIMPWMPLLPNRRYAVQRDFEILKK